ncbi:amidohydrolase family protein [uncultured Draconibacterium sp.]|uniref:amidohydrolase family protein n=1 Tax=uncultured Draconibacterium sp. TaxID=1573823 RepID=UPI00325FE72C
MSENIPVFDAHAHILYGINGVKRGAKTSTGNYGKIVWRGEELTFLPPNFYDTRFTAETLLETMNFSGVSKAVLLQNPVIGILNTEIRQAIINYPDRFYGTIQVNPMKKDACAIVKKFASENQNTLKLEISEEWGWSGNYPGFSLKGKEMMKVWDTVANSGLRVIVDTGDIFNNGYQVENISFIAERFPETKILIEHLGFYRTGLDETARARRNEMLALGKDLENVFFGFSSTAAFINDDYPCVKALELLKEAVEIMGAHKILWGSDIPSTFKKYTYRQLIDVVAWHATFLTSAEKQLLLHDNAASFFE